MPRLVLVLLTAFVCLAVTTSAADADRRGKAYAAHGAWDQELAAVDALLLDGEWQRGLREAEKLKKKIVKVAAPSPDAREVLSELALQHAIAYANLRDRPSAAWYWYTANALDLRMQRRDVSAYGVAEALFRELQPRALQQVPEPFTVWTDFEDPRFEAPPERPFKIPKTLARSIVQGPGTPFMVEFILDRDGTPRQPVVESDTHPPMVVFHYLDWIWGSEMEPARLAGEPVPILFLMQRNLINDRWVETSRGFNKLPTLKPPR